MEQIFEPGVYYNPGKKVLYYFSVNRIFAVILFSIVIEIGFNFLSNLLNFKQIIDVGSWIIFIVGIIFCVGAFITAFIKYKSVEFMFNDFAFSIRRGFFSKSEISIPYRQIQYINHSQSFNDKILGVMKIVVETAGDDDSGDGKNNEEGVLPILDAKIALSLEKELLKRSNISSSPNKI